jgi:hypothetical protein
VVHSGRQLGTLPTKSGKQEQAAWTPITLHSELGPHGEGTHGLASLGGIGSETEIILE